MTFTPGYKRRRWTYSFRAWLDPETAWGNFDQQHARHQNRPCNCLKLWDINWRSNGHNIIRTIRGKHHFVVMFGPKYRRIGYRRKHYELP